MRSIFFLSGLLFLAACNQDTRLRILGPKVAVVKHQNGTTIVDSVDYTIPPFQFVDQDSAIVNSATVQNKIFVADFFFTSCPSICPKMMAEMLKINDKYKDNPNVVILSYSIDPVRDSVARLKAYQKKLGLTGGNWHFLTGNKDSIYQLADKYLVSAAEDPDAPGGYIHSGTFILIDKQRRIRSYCDGTSDDGVEILMGDMDILLEKKNRVFSFGFPVFSQRPLQNRKLETEKL